MRSLILSALLGISVGVSATVAGGSTAQVAVVGDIAPSVVAVNIDGGGHGSGTVVKCEQIAEDLWAITILTARHVASPVELEFMSPEEREMYPWSLSVLGQRAHLLTNHPALDASLIQVILDKPLPVAKLRHEGVLAGEDLYVMGFSVSGEDLWISKGVASSPDRGGSAAPGDSGGAVFDERGNLVGVVNAIDSLGFNGLVWHHHYFAPIADLTDWLAENGLK